MSVGGQAVCVCVCLLVLLQFHQAAAQITSISEGREFFLGFIDVLFGSSGRMELIIATPSNKNVTVDISVPRMGNWSDSVTVTKEQSATVTLPSYVRGSGTELADKGVHIVASEAVSVLGVSKAFSLTDTYLALPLDRLGQEYYAITYSMQPECVIVATDNSTAVSFPVPYPVAYAGRLLQTGQTITITMEKFQTLHLHRDSKDYDFTGMRILATKPVAVICGSKYTSIGSNYWDHAMEMLLPVELYGTSYVTVHIPHAQQGPVYKALAMEEDTTIAYGGQTYTIRHAGDTWTQILPSNTFSEIRADKPVTMVMISRSYNGKDNTMGYPSMLVLPPKKLYGNTCTWGTPVDTSTNGSVTNSLTVVIDKSKVAGLVLDGEASLTWKGQTDIKGTDMVSLWMDLREGGGGGGGGSTHVLQHREPGVTFLAMLSGVTASHISNYLSPACFASALYQCSITGDPHLLSYRGQTVSLALPCAYVITKLRLINSFVAHSAAMYGEIVVDVWGGNSQRPVNGRFYASDVCIKVTIGPHSNTYCTGEFLIANGTIWTNETADTLHDRVIHSYDAAKKEATFAIEGTSFQLMFRAINRERGNFQPLKPGIFIQVQSRWLIPDPSLKFPATLCSTFDDTDSIAKEASAEGISHRLMGIFGVLKHMEGNIPLGDQDDQCPNFQTKLQVCNREQRNQAIKQCFGLMRTARIERCLVKKIGQASQVILDCLDALCTNGTIGCPEMRNHTKSCSDISKIVTLDVCP